MSNFCLIITFAFSSHFFVKTMIMQLNSHQTDPTSNFILRLGRKQDPAGSPTRYEKVFRENLPFR